ncbi:DUF3311 domain-containing protein [Affinibrenneria salicis]|uniref:DUF3311 domain-containing protein n=1 Tax=Affinibrenneria salicis TaxID=2590031 RepID=A0A5J5G1T6_9GAMM|nr:DUF3311 domain-containing protein [Affinibrenneria salicis]KAA9000694.1 DUF3311 domain-containing protein [Affinibrenneria salicis]
MKCIILTAIPFIWIVALVPFANRVEPMIFGIPFLACWMIAGGVVSWFCLHNLYRQFANKDDDEHTGGNA